jgi:glycosyltransferase involved in cell wall biosynthesis
VKKILLIHNTYKNIGGEDIAVENEIFFLKEYFEVETLYFSNKKLLSFQNVISFLTGSNNKSNKILLKKINEFKPDYAYVHNTWYNASLGIFKILSSRNISVLLKLHNFRYFCTRSIFSVDHFGKNTICHACGSNKDDQGFFNRYFEDSIIKSILVALYGKRYFKLINTFNMKILVLTKFHKTFLQDLSIDAEKISVFPNYIQTKAKSSEKKENTVVYAGRVSQEKGVEELIEAFINTDNINNVTLKIIGDGPKLAYLKKKYPHPLVNFLGVISNKEVLDHISSSLAVVTATKMFEGQPTLLCEASSLGVPSIFPVSGGIGEFFPSDYCLSYDQFNYGELTRKLEMIFDKNFAKNIGNENFLFLEKYLSMKELHYSINKILL